MWFRKLCRTVQVRSSIGETKASIAISEDKLMLYSFSEQHGRTDVPYCDEVDPEAEEMRFPLATDLAATTKYRYNGAGAVANYVYRSPDAADNTKYILKYGNGNFNTAYANEASGVSWLCCM